MPDYDIYVDEEKLGAFDGVEIELEEIKEKFTSVQEKFVTVDHGMKLSSSFIISQYSL